MAAIETSQQNFNNEVLKALDNKEDVLVRHGIHSTILVAGKCDNDNQFTKIKISAAFKIMDSGK